MARTSQYWQSWAYWLELTQPHVTSTLESLSSMEISSLMRVFSWSTSSLKSETRLLAGMGQFVDDTILVVPWNDCGAVVRDIWRQAQLWAPIVEVPMPLERRIVLVIGYRGANDNWDNPNWFIGFVIRRCYNLVELYYSITLYWRN